MRTLFFSVFISIQITSLILAKYLHQGFYILFFISIPLLLLAISETIQTTHTIMKNYPLLGRMRYWMEALRRQKFISTSLKVILMELLLIEFFEV